MKPGWIPSWDEGFYDPSEFADPAGELLAREFGDDPVVRQLIAEVAATPVDPDAVAGRMGGFSSWVESLADRSDRDLVAGLAEAEHQARVAAARQVALVQEFCSRQGGSYWVDGRGRFAGHEFVGDHLALAIGISLRSATNRINEAESLRAYPKVLAALGVGLISMPGVRAFLREVTGLDLTQGPELAAAV